MISTLISVKAIHSRILLLSQYPEKGVTSRNGMGLADRRCRVLSGLIRKCYAIQSIFILKMSKRGVFFLHVTFSIGGYIVNMQEKSEVPSGREANFFKKAFEVLVRHF